MHTTVFKNAREWKRVQQTDLSELTLSYQEKATKFFVFIFCLFFFKPTLDIDLFENVWKAVDLCCRTMHVCV